MKEIWKDMPEYEGYYQVSNLGRIKSLIGKEKILSPWVLPRGRAKIRLHKYKKYKVFDVGLLVVNLFLGCDLDKFKIKNKDGNNLNNSADNILINPILENKAKEPVIKKSVTAINKYGTKYISVYWNRKNKFWYTQVWDYDPIIIKNIFHKNGHAAPIGNYPTKKEAVWNMRKYISIFDNKH